MARTKRSRSARKTTAKDEVILSPLPPPVAVAAATVLATPNTAAGTKRRRDDAEDENDEDAFYGRRSAKSRSKKVKNPGGKDTGQGKKGRLTHYCHPQHYFLFSYVEILTQPIQKITTRKNRPRPPEQQQQKYLGDDLSSIRTFMALDWRRGFWSYKNTTFSKT